MGINYYLEVDSCNACGRSRERLHIGKSSAGWCFSLHVIPERGINSLNDWEMLWADHDTKIVDEYGAIKTVDEMKDTILNRGDPIHPTERLVDVTLDNDALPGPNGLLRHKIGSHCVGHGDGTYDLIPGEFC